MRDLPPHGLWDVKLRVGGQIEVEFIAQVLQLIHARDARRCAVRPRETRCTSLEQAGLLSR